VLACHVCVTSASKQDAVDGLSGPVVVLGPEVRLLNIERRRMSTAHDLQLEQLKLRYKGLRRRRRNLRGTDAAERRAIAELDAGLAAIRRLLKAPDYAALAVKVRQRRAQVAYRSGYRGRNEHLLQFIGRESRQRRGGLEVRSSGSGLKPHEVEVTGSPTVYNAPTR
jgi:hypothetical protein